MTKPKKKALSLSKETLRALSKVELHAAAGGVVASDAGNQTCRCSAHDCDM